MTEAFEDFRDDFEHQVEQANANLKKAQTATGDKSSFLEAAQGNVREAERYVKMLDAEARSGNSAEKRQMQQAVKGFRDTVASLREKIDRANLVPDQAPASAQDANGLPTDVNQRMQEYNKRNKQAGDTLEGAARTINETKDIGVNITTNLQQQGEQIRRADERVVETKQNAREGGAIIKQMGRKAATSKLFLWLVILGLGAGLVAAILWKVGVI